MTDKSKLKVFEIPFTTEVKGTILVLATSPEAAENFIDQKIEEGSFGWDKSNLTEEGVLHDGSMVFDQLKDGDIRSGTPKERPDLKPEEHFDWDAFDDDEPASEQKGE